jgi:hypothetical protein
MQRNHISRIDFGVIDRNALKEADSARSSSSSSSSSSSESRGGIVLPMITKGLQSINLVESSSGMCGVMLLLLGCGP